MPLELLIMQWIDFNLDFPFISLLNIIFILGNPMKSELAFEGILTWVQKVRNATLDGTFPLKACLPSCISIVLLLGATKRPSEWQRKRQAVSHWLYTVSYQISKETSPRSFYSTPPFSFTASFMLEKYKPKLSQAVVAGEAFPSGFMLPYWRPTDWKDPGLRKSPAKK